ncbi:helix-turn-helix domain-containing protein [Streptomyces sp. M10(2022)]
MAEPVRVRRLTEQEGRTPAHRAAGQYQHGAVPQGDDAAGLGGGNTVPVIANLVQADEDTVRDGIHRFNEIGLAGLGPQWAGGRPRLLSDDDEEFVIQTPPPAPPNPASPSPAGRSASSSTICGATSPDQYASAARPCAACSTVAA